MADYLHPSTSSKIIDNSFVFQTAQGNTVLFACGMAQQGPDGVLTRLTSVAQASFIFGEPNMSTTGQTMYNVFNWLQSGGEVYFIRVLPANATHSYLDMYIRYDDTNNVITPIYRLEGVYRTEAALQAEVNKAPVVNGTVTDYPLCMFVPKSGAGETNNSLGVKFTLRTNLDATYAARTYDLSFTDVDSLGSTLTVEGPFLVSFEPTAKNRASNESMFFVDVINKYSQFMKVLIPQSGAYLNNLNAIRGFVRGATPNIHLASVDILFGTGYRNSTVDNHFVSSNNCKWAVAATTGLRTNQVTQAVTVHTDGAWFFDPTGVVRLIRGSNGTWTNGTDTEPSQLAKAYSGVTDPAVLDKKRYQLDVMLDANYDTVVKSAMNDMSSSIRGDLMAFLDTGFQANYTGALAVRADSIGFSSFNTAIFSQALNVTDMYTGSVIKVTPTYYLAKKIPQIDNDFGMQFSFSGPRRGVIAGFESVDFIPNEPEKESLYKAQVNYIEQDPKRYNFATQLTSQTVASALSKIANVRALLRMRRDVEAMMDEYRDEMQDAVTYNAMNYNLSSYLAKWISNRTCKSISGSVYASDYDRQQNIVRVKVELVFNGLIERIAIDFVINR